MMDVTRNSIIYKNKNINLVQKMQNLWKKCQVK